MPPIPPEVDSFLQQYPAPVREGALQLRRLLFENLPGVTETLDLPARMIAYGYAPTYKALVCTVFPSQKGLKLGFNRGIDLTDPEGLLEGTGKISRYVAFKTGVQPETPALIALIHQAEMACRVRMAASRR